MAIEHSLSVSKLCTLNTPNSPLKHSHIPSLFINFKPLSSSSSSAKTRRLVSGGAISYSNGYSNSAVAYDSDRFGGGAQYPPPTELPWKKELCNSVQLIGIVASPVQIKHLPSGKVIAWSRLAVKKSQTDTCWINLTFWDELAHVAFQHVEKGRQIYVSGRLVSDSVEGVDGKQQTYYKVVVQQINFIEKNTPSPIALYDGESNSMAPGTKPKNYTANSTGSIQELWQAFFANPMEWWDNRKNKRSPNYPDFKHKSTGESLWVEGRNNPSWVKSQLAILDTRMEALHDQSNGMHVNFMNGDIFPHF